MFELIIKMSRPNIPVASFFLTIIIHAFGAHWLKSSVLFFVAYIPGFYLGVEICVGRGPLWTVPLEIWYWLHSRLTLYGVHICLYLLKFTKCHIPSIYNTWFRFYLAVFNLCMIWFAIYMQNYTCTLWEDNNYGIHVKFYSKTHSCVSAIIA